MNRKWNFNSVLLGLLVIIVLYLLPEVVVTGFKRLLEAAMVIQLSLEAMKASKQPGL